MREGLEQLLQKANGVKPPSVPRVSRVKMTLLWLVGAATVVGILVWLSLGHPFPLIQTRGEIANRQRDLLVFATALALLVLLPVYFMIFIFAWRYRAGHKKAYKPEWDSHKGLEALWWGIPIAIITVLAVVTWQTSHSLDPFKPLASSAQTPLRIQVVALQWKWLFLYPNERVASVNEVAFPVGRPVEFTLTSDAPMNSFWIPQLAGQIYAMSGMSTKLHISADQPGDYRGMSSNISGKGFADMTFTARAMTHDNYAQWLRAAGASEKDMNDAVYASLATPGKASVSRYTLSDASLYDHVIMKYMGNHGEQNQSQVKPTEGNNSSQADPQSDKHTEHGGHH